MDIARKLHLPDHPWLSAPPLTRLLSMLNEDELTARLVGGCVRDCLLGREITDIDIACSLLPQEAMLRLQKAGIKVIPTGIKHGTITAVIDKNNFEITTLRRDEENYGRHARVAFTDDWLEDARRRDFTINALYLDGNGSLYDPCNGLTDISARRIRFIGDANDRIREDALRILRFFRFSARIGDGELEPEGLAACIKNKKLIDNLSGERLAQEIFKILKAEQLLSVIRVMDRSDILAHILPGHGDLVKFNDYVRLENALGRSEPLARLSCLVGPAVDKISRHLRLSNHQAKILSGYATHDIPIDPEMTEKSIGKAIYQNGREKFIFALLQNWAEQGAEAGDVNYGHILAYAEGWQIPDFPVKGRDLMARGIKGGPEMGRILHRLEREWLA
ncbi:CCA tRNA nucleotidyltransferase, partial [hydrothermal vent metagenome]